MRVATPAAERRQPGQGEQGERGGFGNARRAPRPVRQEQAQVVVGDEVVAAEISRAPLRLIVPVVGQEDAQVVIVYRSVEVGVANGDRIILGSSSLWQMRPS